MSLKLLSLALFAITAHATPLEKTNLPREECTPCNPSGATGSTSPSIGPDLKPLYINLLASVQGISFSKRWTDEPLSPRASFCCRETLDCLTVHSLNIPMCYDKFTTSYKFPDGSFGSLTTGDYTSGAAHANLLSGEYTAADGRTGDIYADDPAAKPNTATLSVPPQWTAAGVGTAIPASELGSVAVTTGTASLGPTGGAGAQATGTGTEATSTLGGVSAEPTAAESTGAAGRVGEREERGTTFGVAVVGGLVGVLWAL